MIIIKIISYLLMVVGFFGILIPALPDLILIFIGILIFAISTNFQKIDLLYIIIFALIALTSYLVDYLSTVYGIKRFGASRIGVVGAIIGMLAGLLLLPPFGLIIGAILGTILFELIFANKELKHAIKSGLGAVFGVFLSVIIKVVLASIMIGLFIYLVRK